MLRNRLQITFNEEGDSSQAMAVFFVENTKVKNGHCLRVRSCPPHGHAAP